MLNIHIDFTISNWVGIMAIMASMGFCLLIYWVGLDDGLNTHVHGSDESEI